jgi:phage tail-like protein
MARPSSKDPLDKFRWSVSIDGFTRLGFTSVEAPSMTVSSKSYPEGGAHLFPKKIIDTVSYAPITLQRGVTGDSSFIEWARSIFNPIAGVVGSDGTTIDQNGIPEYRRDVQISHLDRAGRPVVTYILHNAYPTEYKPASDFSADADDTFSIEKLVLEYESFEVSIASQKNNPFSVKDISKRLIRNLF